MFAASDHDANMLYVTGMFVPDAFIFLRLRRRDYVVMSDLEVDRARREAPHCRVLSLSRRQQGLRERGIERPATAQVIHSILREKRVRRVAVPGDFPLQLARELEKLGVGSTGKPGSFFPEREQKSTDETKRIVEALRLTEAAMAEAFRVLKMSKIGRDRRLICGGTPLTSERLRASIDTVITQGGGQAKHTIVAGGNHACDPHESGYGPLRANEPIILDIFPRMGKTGYFGDLTRTVVKGRASEAVRRLYDTVFHAQEIAFARMRPGVPTADVHRSVQEYFGAQGCKTGKHNGRMQGFFHGTGHGLGLEIHEAPRMGPNSIGTLKPGNVVTVEPGLYYPGIGGLRLEDVALITSGRPRNLTRIEKALEI